MSNEADQNQPSMEEILASIRRIISEEDSANERRNPAPQGVAGEPARRPAAPDLGVPRPKPEDESVLPLTRMVDRDGKVVDLAKPAAQQSSERPAARAEPTLAMRETPAREAPSREPPAPEAKAAVERDAAPPARPREMGEAGRGSLLSERSATAATEALAQMAQMRRGEQAHKAAPVPEVGSLDAYLREAMVPLLRQWLDDNLPALVERVVRDEVRRLARRLQDD